MCAIAPLSFSCFENIILVKTRHEDSDQFIQQPYRIHFNNSLYKLMSTGLQRTVCAFLHITLINSFGRWVPIDIDGCVFHV